MPFLCPTEVLRMFPPVPFITRECTKPFKLETPSGGSYDIEVGTPVLIPVYSLHYDPQHFPHPKIFDPDRFSEENKKSRHKYIYLPFGEGPRICLGTYESVIIHKSFIATDLE
jgi:cytochrome P450 family 6